MGIEGKKAKLLEYIIITLMIISCIALYLTSIFKTAGGIAYISAAVMFFAAFIIMPLLDYLEKDYLRTRLTFLLIIARLSVFISYIITSYKVFFTKNYDLKYTYWVLLAAFLVMISGDRPGKIIQDCRKRRLEGKKHNALYAAGSILLLLILCLLLTCLVSKAYFHPVQQVVLKDIKLPQSIAIYEKDDKYENSGASGMGLKGKIDSADDIKVILKDLQSVKIENITSTELLNYERMKENNPPVYRLIFEYDNAGNEERLLENGYIDYIVVMANRSTVIEDWRDRDSHTLLWRFYNAIYPISLSDEAIDRIFSYIK